MFSSIEEAEAFFKRFIDIAVSLSSEHDIDHLVERILIEARALTNAEGGTIYLVDPFDLEHISFSLLFNDKLKIHLGGTSQNKVMIPPMPLYKDGKPNLNNVAAAAFHIKEPIVLADAYEDTQFDFSGTRAFDENNDYRSQSFMTIPMLNQANEVIGVLQLINARDQEYEVISFPDELRSAIEGLTSMAAVAIEGARMMRSQKELWDSLIKLVATAVDLKSIYTGGHCQRVPLIAHQLAEKCCEIKEGPFADFGLNEIQWEELDIAAWLHDCGKIATPEHVVDKAVKLETIYNRINEIRTRFEVLLRDAKIAMLERILAGEDKTLVEVEYQSEIKGIEEDFRFISEINKGSEFMAEDKLERLNGIAKRRWVMNLDYTLGLSGDEEKMLKEKNVTFNGAEEVDVLEDRPEHVLNDINRGDLYNLSIERGTLTFEEREIINKHVTMTIQMLETLPFPKQYSNIIDIAGQHHERLDGNGYPNKLTSKDLGIRSRILCIADVFEALTAADRPYKAAKKITECLKIMMFMCQEYHLDAELYVLFLQSGLWKEYAQEHMRPDQLNEVNVSDYFPKNSNYRYEKTPY